MLKRWQQLAEPRLSSCLQSIPGVYTRAEILHNVQEENEEDLVTPENDCEGLMKRSSLSSDFSSMSDVDRLSFSMEKYSPETPTNLS